ncbi:MAG: N-acetylmuramic acid 6-phosphate etherase, partial [Planctomycetes bacterium]|nr:N-acetylmuramic acid 6-phosphate etherase [Planctomycetota bacterium]
MSGIPRGSGADGARGRAAAPSQTPDALLPGSEALHRLAPDEVLALFEREDRRLLEAVHGARAAIADLAGRMAHAMECGGRMIYAGAGTSGRLGALDAAEWGPTFGVEPGRVLAIVAGGKRALSQAVEGAEDRRDEAVAALDDLDLAARDLVIGITASGTTP